MTYVQDFDTRYSVSNASYRHAFTVDIHILFLETWSCQYMHTAPVFVYIQSSLRVSLNHYSE